jgi:hypothetical protein
MQSPMNIQRIQDKQGPDNLGVRPLSMKDRCVTSKVVEPWLPPPFNSSPVLGGLFYFAPFVLLLRFGFSTFANGRTTVATHAPLKENPGKLLLPAFTVGDGLLFRYSIQRQENQRVHSPVVAFPLLVFYCTCQAWNTYAADTAGICFARSHPGPWWGVSNWPNYNQNVFLSSLLSISSRYGWWLSNYLSSFLNIRNLDFYS